MVDVPPPLISPPIFDHGDLVSALAELVLLNGIQNGATVLVKFWPMDGAGVMVLLDAFGQP